MKTNQNILVIDDEQLIIDSVKKIASLDNYKIFDSLNAKEALKILNKEDVDLIISDIMMPEVDGFQLLEEINKKNLEVPIIMTTGYSTVENAVRSLTEGAIDFIPKPFTFDELLSAIKRGLNYRALKKKIATEDIEDTVLYVPCPSKWYKLGYSSWLKLEREGSVLIGVTDLFLKCIDSFNEIEFFDINAETIQGSACAYLNSEELKHTILSPITGTIIDKNDNLLDNISIIEKDPFFEGWLYRIIPSDLAYEIKNITLCGE